MVVTKRKKEGGAKELDVAQESRITEMICFVNEPILCAKGGKKNANTNRDVMNIAVILNDSNKKEKLLILRKNYLLP